jgi:hypothetical protein
MYVSVECLYIIWNMFGNDVHNWLHCAFACLSSPLIVESAGEHKQSISSVGCSTRSCWKLNTSTRKHRKTVIALWTEGAGCIVPLSCIGTNNKSPLHFPSLSSPSVETCTLVIKHYGTVQHSCFQHWNNVLPLPCETAWTGSGASNSCTSWLKRHWSP